MGRIQEEIHGIFTGRATEGMSNLLSEVNKCSGCEGNRLTDTVFKIYGIHIFVLNCQSFMSIMI
jgi:hypothetical protein